jgi:hypothetical protein
MPPVHDHARSNQPSSLVTAVLMHGLRVARIATQFGIPFDLRRRQQLGGREMILEMSGSEFRLDSGD